SSDRALCGTPRPPAGGGRTRGARRDRGALAHGSEAREGAFRASIAEEGEGEAGRNRSHRTTEYARQRRACREGQGSVTRREERLAAAVEWILGLTLVGDMDLGMFVGVDEPDARGLRATLTGDGWTETVTPHGDGLLARPLALIREEALLPLAKGLGMTVAELTSQWPVGRTAILERIARHEVGQGVNRTLALLASQ